MTVAGLAGPQASRPEPHQNLGPILVERHSGTVIPQAGLPRSGKDLGRALPTPTEHGPPPLSQT